jgi:hypothetical protein
MLWFFIAPFVGLAGLITFGKLVVKVVKERHREPPTPPYSVNPRTDSPQT